MLGTAVFFLTLVAQELGFDFVLEKLSRFQISFVVWGIILDFCTNVRISCFESSSRGLGTWRSFILGISYFEI